MDITSKVFSDIVIYDNYAKYLQDAGRREVWEEIVERCKQMHIRKFPALADRITSAFEMVHDKKVMPSMRSLQFGGRPIELNPTRIFNCSFVACDDPAVFSETMFLLLCGTGVGYSVQKRHVSKLPVIRKPLKRKRRFLVSDSIEGWADAVKVLMASYFKGGYTVEFDFADIRPKGALLKTSGGRAPGPEPLKECLHQIARVLDRKESGEKLRPIECHDIFCHMADAVLAGGIRRAAMISLFDLDDEEMLTSKYGSWYELDPQRARANNSAVIVRHKIKKDRFVELMKRVEASGSGEPGIFLTNDPDMGTNPCAEIALRSNCFCNLTTINGAAIDGQEDFNKAVEAAAFIGTLQASYTNFHYLREIWKETTEKDALLGISITGIASGNIDNLDTEEAVKRAIAVNEEVSKIIGINKAARITCVKPEGTTSSVLGTSSGIHEYHDAYYIRRKRITKTSPLFKYLAKKIPSFMENDILKPERDAVISIPIAAPHGAVTRNDSSAIKLLERVKKIYEGWVLPGHRRGANTHNVSCTVSVKQDEWNEVTEWMWKNRDSYSGISLLPYDGGTYVQAPFESITKEQYEKLHKLFVKEAASIDLSEVHEKDDGTTKNETVACGGGACEIS